MITIKGDGDEDRRGEGIYRKWRFEDCQKMGKIEEEKVFIGNGDLRIAGKWGRSFIVICVIIKENTR